jgi:hypothetical protein
MTNIIQNKYDKEQDDKKNKKLVISRNKKKSRFKDGVLNLSKNFMKTMNKKNK